MSVARPADAADSPQDMCSDAYLRHVEDLMTEQRAATLFEHAERAATSGGTSIARACERGRVHEAEAGARAMRLLVLGESLPRAVAAATAASVCDALHTATARPGMERIAASLARTLAALALRHGLDGTIAAIAAVGCSCFLRRAGLPPAEAAKALSLAACERAIEESRWVRVSSKAQQRWPEGRWRGPGGDMRMHMGREVVSRPATAATALAGSPSSPAARVLRPESRLLVQTSPGACVAASLEAADGPTARVRLAATGQSLAVRWHDVYLDPRGTVLTADAAPLEGLAEAPDPADAWLRGGWEAALGVGSRVFVPVGDGVNRRWVPGTVTSVLRGQAGLVGGSGSSGIAAAPSGREDTARDRAALLTEGLDDGTLEAADLAAIRCVLESDMAEDGGGPLPVPSAREGEGEGEGGGEDERGVEESVDEDGSPPSPTAPVLSMDALEVEPGDGGRRRVAATQAVPVFSARRWAADCAPPGLLAGTLVWPLEQAAGDGAGRASRDEAARLRELLQGFLGSTGGASLPLAPVGEHPSVVGPRLVGTWEEAESGQSWVADLAFGPALAPASVGAASLDPAALFVGRLTASRQQLCLFGERPLLSESASYTRAPSPPRRTSPQLRLAGRGFVDLGSAGAWGLRGNAPFTVAAWVRLRPEDWRDGTDDEGGATDPVAFTLFSLQGAGRVGESGSRGGFALGLSDDRRLCLLVAGAGGDGSRAPLLAPDPLPCDGQWVHVAAVFDGSRGRLAVDGAVVAEGGVGRWGIGGGAGRALVGASPSDEASESFWRGNVAGLALWGRAMDETGLASSAQGPPDADDHNLLGHWPLCGLPAAAVDLGPLRRHGQLSGDAEWEDDCGADPSCPALAQAPLSAVLGPGGLADGDALLEGRGAGGSSLWLAHKIPLQAREDSSSSFRARVLLRPSSSVALRVATGGRWTLPGGAGSLSLTVTCPPDESSDAAVRLCCRSSLQAGPGGEKDLVTGSITCTRNGGGEVDLALTVGPDEVTAAVVWSDVDTPPWTGTAAASEVFPALGGEVAALGAWAGVVLDGNCDPALAVASLTASSSPGAPCEAVTVSPIAAVHAPPPSPAVQGVDAAGALRADPACGLLHLVVAATRQLEASLMAEAWSPEWEMEARGPWLRSLAEATTVAEVGAAVATLATFALLPPPAGFCSLAAAAGHAVAEQQVLQMSDLALMATTVSTPVLALRQLEEFLPSRMLHPLWLTSRRGPWLRRLAFVQGRATKDTVRRVAVRLASDPACPARVPRSEGALPPLVDWAAVVEAVEECRQRAGDDDGPPLRVLVDAEALRDAAGTRLAEACSGSPWERRCQWLKANTPRLPDGAAHPTLCPGPRGGRAWLAPLYDTTWGPLRFHEDGAVCSHSITARRGESGSGAEAGALVMDGVAMGTPPPLDSWGGGRAASPLWPAWQVTAVQHSPAGAVSGLFQGECGAELDGPAAGRASPPPLAMRGEVIGGDRTEWSAIKAGIAAHRDWRVCGLRNLGNTCYQNSLLQCLFANQAFREAVLALPPPDAPEGADAVAALPSSEAAGTVCEADAKGGDASSAGAVAADSRRDTAQRRAVETVAALQRLFAEMQGAEAPFLSPRAWHRALPPDQWGNLRQQDPQEFAKWLMDQVEAAAGVCRPLPPPDASGPSAAAATKGVDSPSTLFEGTLESSLACDACAHRSVTQQKFAEVVVDFPRDFAPITHLALLRRQGGETAASDSDEEGRDKLPAAPPGYDRLPGDLNAGRVGAPLLCLCVRRAGGGPRDATPPPPPSSTLRRKQSWDEEVEPGPREQGVEVVTSGDQSAACGEPITGLHLVFVRFSQPAEGAGGAGTVATAMRAQPEAALAEARRLAEERWGASAHVLPMDLNGSGSGPLRPPAWSCEDPRLASVFLVHTRSPGGSPITRIEVGAGPAATAPGPEGFVRVLGDANGWCEQPQDLAVIDAAPNREDDGEGSGGDSGDDSDEEDEPLERETDGDFVFLWVKREGAIRSLSLQSEAALLQAVGRAGGPTPTPAADAALPLRWCAVLNRVWRSDGMRCAGPVSFWRPVLPAGCVNLGSVVSGSRLPPAGALVAEDRGDGSVAPAEDMECVWHTKGSRALQRCSIWRPLPPAGYVAVGHLCAHGYAKPRCAAAYCVRADLVERAAWSECVEVWSELGSEADCSCTIFRTPTPCGLFLAHDEYAQPKSRVAWQVRAGAAQGARGLAAAATPVGLPPPAPVYGAIRTGVASSPLRARELGAGSDARTVALPLPGACFLQASTLGVAAALPPLTSLRCVDEEEAAALCGDGDNDSGAAEEATSPAWERVLSLPWGRTLLGQRGQGCPISDVWLVPATGHGPERGSSGSVELVPPPPPPPPPAAVPDGDVPGVALRRALDSVPWWRLDNGSLLHVVPAAQVPRGPRGAALPEGGGGSPQSWTVLSLVRGVFLAGDAASVDPEQARHSGRVSVGLWESMGPWSAEGKALHPGRRGRMRSDTGEPPLPGHRRVMETRRGLQGAEVNGVLWGCGQQDSEGRDVWWLDATWSRPGLEDSHPLLLRLCLPDSDADEVQDTGASGDEGEGEGKGLGDVAEGVVLRRDNPLRLAGRRALGASAARSVVGDEGPEPIVEVAVLLDTESAPPGFEVVTECGSARVADLNEGNEGSYVHLAVRRSRRGLPVMAVTTIYPDGEPVPPGFDEVRYTPSMEEANLTAGVDDAPRLALCVRHGDPPRGAGLLDSDSDTEEEEEGGDDEGPKELPLTELIVWLADREDAPEGADVLWQTPSGMDADVNAAASGARVMLASRRAGAEGDGASHAVNGVWRTTLGDMALLVTGRVVGVPVAGGVEEPRFVAESSALCGWAYAPDGVRSTVEEAVAAAEEGWERWVEGEAGPEEVEVVGWWRDAHCAGLAPSGFPLHLSLHLGQEPRLEGSRSFGAISAPLRGGPDRGVSLHYATRSTELWLRGRRVFGAAAASNSLSDMVAQHLGAEAVEWECSGCGHRSVHAVKSTDVVTPPRHLHVVVQRFAFDCAAEAEVAVTKNDSHVEMPAVLSVPVGRRGASDGARGGDGGRWEAAFGLYGVLVHAGPTTNSGHYYAFVRPDEGVLWAEDAPSNPWRRADDTTVTRTSYADMMQFLRTQTHCSAYMAMYRRLGGEGEAQEAQEAPPQDRDLARALRTTALLAPQRRPMPQHLRDWVDRGNAERLLEAQAAQDGAAGSGNCVYE